jgi:hypothetical protein
MKRKEMWTTCLVALSLLGGALPAGATATIWGTPTGANCTGSAPATSSQGTHVYANCAPPDIGGMRLTHPAWSDTGAVGSSLQQAYVGAYAGSGVTSRAGPNSAAIAGVNGAGAQETTNANDKALDNSGNYEILLLRFSDATTNVSTPGLLNALNIAGFTGVDSDLTVMAYGGVGSPNLVGNSSGNPLGSGWNLVRNYTDVASNTATPANSLSFSASYWLIGAYNNAFGSGGNLTTGNDYVRLLSVTASTLTSPSGPAPEPSSIVLTAVALLGLTALRRRRPA